MIVTVGLVWCAVVVVVVEVVVRRTGVC